MGTENGHPQREGKRPGSKDAFQGYVPKWLNFLSLHTVCYGFCHLPTSEPLGNKPWRDGPLRVPANGGWCTARLGETLGRSGEPSISLGSCSLRVPQNLLIGNFNHNPSTLLCHTVCHDQGMMPVPTLRNHGGGDAQEICSMQPEPQNYEFSFSLRIYLFPYPSQSLLLTSKTSDTFLSGPAWTNKGSLDLTARIPTTWKIKPVSSTPNLPVL